MTNPTVRIYTSVNEYIDREMNTNELKQYKIDQAEANAQKAEAEAKATAKAALLERLGITEDEAKLLLS
jgi:regulator of protease activity HflC (stomatin/prohibitin superfamily)